MNAEKTGEFIKSLRKEKNITQQELAGIINVSDKAVSRWETGRGYPDIENLESIADALGVTAAELMKGERFSGEITGDDIKEASETGLRLARDLVEKKKWSNLITGFIVGAVILLVLFVHLLSPAPIKGAEGVISVETLGDDKLVGVLDKSVSGCDHELIKDPDSDMTYLFVGCYDTAWHRMFGDAENTVVYLGSLDDADYIFYYPGTEGDQLIWKKPGLDDPDFGVESLPRLAYNFWFIAGLALTLIGIAFSILFRKKYFAGSLVKGTLAAFSFTLSIPIVTAGRAGQVYNAAYFFSGIVILGILLSLLSILIYGNIIKKVQK